MLRVFVAGPPDFVGRIVREADAIQDKLRVVFLANEPSIAVDLLERNAQDCHAVLLGFPDEQTNKLLLDVAMRYGTKFVPFVVVTDLLTGFKQWMPYKAQPVLPNKELSRMLEYFEQIPIESEEKVFFEKDSDVEIQTRVDRVRDKSRNVAISIPRKVVSIFSTKGGIGKTVIAVATAQSVIALAGLRVCIIDLDLTKGYGNAIKYLGCIGADKYQVETTVVAWKDFPYDQKTVWETVERFLFKARNNLYVLPGLRSTAEAQHLTPELILGVLDVLKRHFDLIIMDLGNNLTNLAVSSMEMSDEIFLINSLDTPEIDDMKEFLDDILPYIRVPRSQVNVVFNRIIPEQRFNVEDVAAYIGLPCVAAIPEDMEVRKRLANKGQVPYLGEQDIPFTRELEKILFRLFPREIFGADKPARSNPIKQLLKKIGFAG
jgi:Flp pilus assembly CpaE family ATPase